MPYLCLQGVFWGNFYTKRSPLKNWLMQRPKNGVLLFKNGHNSGFLYPPLSWSLLTGKEKVKAKLETWHINLAGKLKAYKNNPGFSKTTLGQKISALYNIKMQDQFTKSTSSCCLALWVRILQNICPGLCLPLLTSLWVPQGSMTTKLSDLSPKLYFGDNPALGDQKGTRERQDKTHE